MSNLKIPRGQGDGLNRTLRVVGKSTVLRRSSPDENDLIEGCTLKGRVIFDGRTSYAPGGGSR